MNAKKELLRAVGDEKIICAEIEFYPFYEDKEAKLRLKKGHSTEELFNFFNQLDFEYDNGYGTQELYGIVWLEDEAWLERGEYDGSEWWSYEKCPEIKEYLL